MEEISISVTMLDTTIIITVYYMEEISMNVTLYYISITFIDNNYSVLYGRGIYKCYNTFR